MTPRPSRLPRRYREIWDALREADERTRSRADLARRLGISTHTIQRILVDGDVPDFSRPQSVRLTRSWIRAVTRLARGLGHDPRRWVQAVGISWDADAKQASDAALRRTRAAGRRPLPGLLATIRAEAAVDVGIADVRPFSDPGPDGSSFSETCARRLVGAVDPDWEVRFRRGAAADLVDALTAPAPRMAFAAGLLDTVHLRARGLDFLALPGWRLALAAVRVAPRGAAAIDWDGIAAGGPGGGLRILVPEGDPARALVRGQWGRPADLVLVRRPARPEDLADDLLREREARPEEGHALVADEETCRRVLAALRRDRGCGRAFDARRVDAPAGERPRYRLGLAVPAGAGRLRDLLEHAWREELFGASRAATARLYADLLAGAARSLVGPGPAPIELPGNVRPEHFPAADEEFRRTLARRLIAGLGAGEPDPGDDEAWDVLVRRARTLVPPEWRTVVDETAWAAKLAASATAPAATRPFGTWCRSCSGSLREHPSPSPSYCSFCSDENGNLLPREKVHRILAHWITQWQEGISEAEARERATRLMSAMPAWSG